MRSLRAKPPTRSRGGLFAKEPGQRQPDGVGRKEDADGGRVERQRLKNDGEDRSALCPSAEVGRVGIRGKGRANGGRSENGSDGSRHRLLRVKSWVNTFRQL